ncbi:MAG: hypothetical protein CMP20_02770 [Rickettsiales bacterium]|nr:hypothetical protein [Rickettsiales bacterium]
MSCCGQFIDGLVHLVVDSMQNSFQLEENSRPSTPAARSEIQLTYKVQCSKPGTFIVSPNKFDGKRPDSPVIPTHLVVQSYSNATSFDLELHSTLRCSSKKLEIDAQSVEPSVDICILDTRQRLDTAQRFGLTPEDTEENLKESFSHYDSGHKQYYVENTHSISRFVQETGLSSSTMTTHSGGLDASSGLIVVCVGQPELEQAVYTLSEAANVLERVTIDQVALIVQLHGDPVESPQEFECTIQMEYSH